MEFQSMDFGEVTQIASGLITLIAALLSFGTALLTYRSRGHAPAAAPAVPGQAQPPVFSAKAIVKGWVSFVLAYILANMLLAVIVVLVILPAESNYEAEYALNQFLDSRYGFLVLIALTLWISGRPAFAAAKQAHAFPVVHGLASVGSAYLILGLALDIYFPELAHEVPQPHGWQPVEIITFLIGATLGGILGSKN